VSDRIIDIRDYLDGPEEDRSPGAFSVFGGGGERSRFALPVWRAIFLADGDWGGIIALPKANPEASPVPFFVLDLKEEPARTECFRGSFRKLRGQTAPALATTGGGGMVVRLGDDEERIWFLELRGGSGGLALEEGAEETLLFLAGECAGLLFFRKLARSVSE
jgi:hypothetical protein